jgi:hypothetical protein
MSQYFPQNKLALGFAALAFAFAVRSWIIRMGCPGVSLEENNEADG